MPGGRYGLECKIYVGDLPRDASEQELEKAFSYYGALKNVWVARNPPGFAFIEYDDVRDAEDAVRAMDGTTLCGSRIRVEHSSGKSGPKPWSGGGGGRGGGGRDGGGRGPPRLRKPYDPNDRCYECGGRGHYAYDCTKGSGGRRHSRSRSGSRDRSRGRRDRSPSPSRGRYYYRSRSRSRSRGRYRTRSRSGSRSPQRSAARYRSRSRSPVRSNRYSRSRSRERKSDHGSPSRNGGD